MDEDEEKRGIIGILILLIVIAGLGLIAFVLIFGTFTWAWHLVAPESVHWLDKQMVYKIQDVMSGALIAIILRDQGKKIFIHFKSKENE